MKAIKKPIKINCWLITQAELDYIYMKGNADAFSGKLHGAECWFYKERKDEWDKKKGFGNVIAKIRTLEGDMILRAGDYLIKGIKKEFYPCKADIFEKTYKLLT